MSIRLGFGNLPENFEPQKKHLRLGFGGSAFRTMRGSPPPVHGGGSARLDAHSATRTTRPPARHSPRRRMRPRHHHRPRRAEPNRTDGRSSHGAAAMLRIVTTPRWCPRAAPRSSASSPPHSAARTHDRRARRALLPREDPAKNASSPVRARAAKPPAGTARPRTAVLSDRSRASRRAPGSRRLRPAPLLAPR